MRGWGEGGVRRRNTGDLSCKLGRLTRQKEGNSKLHHKNLEKTNKMKLKWQDHDNHLCIPDLWCCCYLKSISIEAYCCPEKMSADPQWDRKITLNLLNFTVELLYSTHFNIRFVCVVAISSAAGLTSWSHLSIDICHLCTVGQWMLL